MFQRKENRPFLIAGPCSAETEDQVMETARGLAALGTIDLFRAGVWKPRTRPGAFEGKGVEALPWLQRVKAETGLRTTIEVANSQQAEEALKAGIDVLWIGARTTVNPFSVQDVADALRGVDIPVMVKNPVNVDLELWMGGIERISRAGVKDIAAIHRGFSSYAKSRLRNQPYWEIAIELRRRMPEMPMICDNSHICGNRVDLLEIAQQALDLNYDGLMTETHPDPDNAWSDAKQQITPETYRGFVESLVVRRESSSDADYIEHIEQLRHKIDELDLEILNLLSRRLRVSDDIGRYKRRHNISILQSARWNDILERGIDEGQKRDLSAGLVERLLSAVHQESIARQHKIIHEQGE